MAEQIESEREFPLVFIGLGCVALFFLLAPALVTVAAAFNDGNYLQFPPDGLSLRWIKKFLTSPLFWDNFTFSFKLALVVTLISTVLGSAASVAMLRVHFFGRETLRMVFLAPIVLPGMVLGLALLAFYATSKIGLMGSYAGLVLAHVLVTFPFVFATVSAALARFDQSLEEAARSLGAGPLRAFWDITVRVIAQGILAGGTFAFVASFGQFDVSLFLATGDMRPLPVALFDAIRFRTDPTIAAAGVFAITTVIISMVVTYLIFNWRGEKKQQGM